MRIYLFRNDNVNRHHNKPEKCGNYFQWSVKNNTHLILCKSVYELKIASSVMLQVLFDNK